MVDTETYLTVEELRDIMQITETNADAALAAVIEAASRAIDNATGDFFGIRGSVVPAVRYVRARYAEEIPIPSAVSVSEVAIDAAGRRTWATLLADTDYELWPFGAADEGKPYTKLYTANYGRYGWPIGIDRGVRVSGVWGWPAVPAPIAHATALLAHRLYKRQTSPFGVTGSAQLGQQIAITKIDPDVQNLIAGYMAVAI